MYNEIDKIIIDGQVCLGLPIYNNVRNRIHYGNIKKDWKLYRVKLAKYQENYKEDLKKGLDHNGVMYASEHLNSC